MQHSHFLSIVGKLDDNFRALSGRPLPSPLGVPDRQVWLDRDAPYSLLAHNTKEEDPHFIYANQRALDCFKYTMEEILTLPSRLSAAEGDRAERQRLLNDVKRDGIAYDYSGPRIDRNGKSFMIYDGVVWQLKHDDGTIWGQAALFWPNEHDRPIWYAAR